jgi:sterol desaturase/sphingolipid hydroxylase (fatty acid hydroxylase superfamily)
MSRSAAVKISLGLGLVYLLIGVLGFIPGITHPSSAPGQGLLLVIFAVNTVNNLAHLVLGAALVWAATTDNKVRMVNRGMAAVFAILVVGSLVAPIVEGVAINPPDTGLHLVSLLVTAAIGFMAVRREPVLA